MASWTEPQRVQRGARQSDDGSKRAGLIAGSGQAELATADQSQFEQSRAVPGMQRSRNAGPVTESPITS